MTAAESVALAGKMWLYEDDMRTYLGTGEFPGAIRRGEDQAKTLTMLRAQRRGGSHAQLRHLVDGPGAMGWFNDRRMWAEMQRLVALDEPLLAPSASVSPRSGRRDRPAEHDPRGCRRPRRYARPASTKCAVRWAAWAHPYGAVS